jgi:hypothetical protein
MLGQSPGLLSTPENLGEPLFSLLRLAVELCFLRGFQSAWPVKVVFLVVILSRLVFWSLV